MQAFYDLVAKAAGITCHSDKVRPGYIFVAIRGRIADGNTFAQTATARGALAIVSDCPENLPPLAIPVFAVPDARLALSDLAATFYQNPSHQLNLVGITGSNGKTTIACMLEHIFVQAGFQTGLIGTICVNTGRSSFPSTLTTPDASSIQYYLSQMLRNKITHAAMEVSAQGIDMHRVAHVRFSAGLLSNICADHLDFHGTFANYLAAKANFLGLLGSGTPLIVNIDNPYCQAIADHFSGRLITTAVDNPADISATINHLTAYGSSFSVVLNKPLTALSGQLLPASCHYDFSLAIPGCHNVENALLATTAALVHGVTPETIVRALADFQGVKRRMDIFHLEGFTVVDDTALNPGSINAVFDTVTTLRYNRLIVINAIRGQRGPSINAAIAAAIAGRKRKLSFELIVTASNDHVGKGDIVTGEERLAFLTTLSTLKTDYTYTSTLPSAIKAGLSHAGAGDLIVLIGAQGMDAGRQVLTALVKTPGNRQQKQDYYPLFALSGITGE